MYNKIKKTRPNDKVLNIGIGLTTEQEADFYLFPNELNAWSTFSKQEADFRSLETGIDYIIKNVTLKGINEIIEHNFDKHPNFISIDVEGLDLEILQSLDFVKYKPEVICVETITFGYLNNNEKKINSIQEFMLSKDYAVYADTHINTIFCRKDLFSFLNS